MLKVIQNPIKLSLPSDSEQMEHVSNDDF